MITELQPWYWQKLPLNQLTGSDVFASLFVCNVSNCHIATLLESPYPIPQENPQLARYSICAGNPRIIDGVPQMWTVNVGGVLPFLEQLLAKKPKLIPFLPLFHLPGVGWVGWVMMLLRKLKRYPSSNLILYRFQSLFGTNQNVLQFWIIGNKFCG